MSDPRSDLDIAVQRVRAGEMAAFADIYQHLSGPLLSYLMTQVRRRDDAEDLVGQVFLEAMRGIERFEGRSAEFRSWLFRIARDRAIDLARRQARRPEDPLESAGDRPAEGTGETQALARIERQRIWAAVARLPDAQREVIVLRLASGLSSAEIAQVLGKQVNAIKALQHRALGNLARDLQDESGVPAGKEAAPPDGGQPARAVPRQPPPTLQE